MKLNRENEIKVMVIEDDKVTLDGLSELLNKESYAVIPADDGGKAMEIFGKEDPDIVITDIKLPGIDGISLMERMKRAKKDVQIILTTAFGETELALDAIRLGALDYLKKPIDIGNLFLALGRAREKLALLNKTDDFPTLLIADDDDVARINIAEVLTAENYHTLQAENGQIAVETFREHKIDVVLLDIKMPKLDGIKALHAMRNISDDFESIILTGYGDETAAIQALRDGAMSFVKKPIDLEEILVLIEKAKQKITLKRSLQYRSRELELANQIIAQITAHEEIGLSVTQGTIGDIRDQCVQLLDFLKDGICIFDSSINLIFTNKTVSARFPGMPLPANRQYVEKMFQSQDCGIAFDAFLSATDELQKSPLGTIKSADTCLLMNIGLKIQGKKEIYYLLIKRESRD